MKAVLYCRRVSIPRLPMLLHKEIYHGIIGLGLFVGRKMVGEATSSWMQGTISNRLHKQSRSTTSLPETTVEALVRRHPNGLNEHS